MATHKGRIKRMALSELASVRPSGLIAITLEDGDRLCWARLTDGNSEIILVTEKGQALRYPEEEVRPMGRSAAGVTAIRLAKNDYVASMEVIEPGGYLTLITTRGFGKRTSLKEYPVKSRGTGGVRTIDPNALDKIGPISAARVVQEADDLTIITAGGLVLRTRVKDISQSGRATRGTRLMNLQNGENVASLARIANAELKSVGADTEP
jgi:DNA gyrase subunit A